MQRHKRCYHGSLRAFGKDYFTETGSRVHVFIFANINDKVVLTVRLMITNITFLLKWSLLWQLLSMLYLLFVASHVFTDLISPIPSELCHRKTKISYLHYDDLIFTYPEDISGSSWNASKRMQTVCINMNISYQLMCT